MTHTSNNGANSATNVHDLTNNDVTDDNVEAKSGDQLIEIKDSEDIEIILRDHHDAVLAGYFGAKRTLKKIKQKHYWKGMYK